MRDLSLHLLDILQNSISAGAKRIAVSIITDKKANLLKIEICDDGIGMDEHLAARVTSPFVTTKVTKKTGLGIPLFKASAELAGGKLTIDSKKGRGTLLSADFQISNIDRLPLGNIAETVAAVVMSEPDIEFGLILDNKEQQFKFSVSEVKEKLGDVPVNQINVIVWVKEFIDEGIKTIFGGVLDEIIG